MLLELDHTQIDYRTCFSTNTGRRVLAHLLTNAGVFDTDIKTPEETAVENYAKGILEIMGLFGKENVDKVQQITDAIINIQT
jgi:hypothetical protein